ncbi:MAG TPA: asparaginase domain-containing protein [Chloroflexota bacterium]|nr:asparaginase domain-containing protein [Chloroflexota bacterium]
MKPRIAIFSGPTATIQNSAPLITSNKARKKYGLPLRTHPDGSPMRFDALRPQRLATPVTVYVEQFSAHPLEADAAELYAPPDGYVDKHGQFHHERQSPDDRPVYEVTLEPDDGLYLLPYMARQADGSAWEGDGAYPGAPAHLTRQPFYPDASRIVEEIDRLGIGEEGTADILGGKTEFDFIRAAPSGGYTKGLAETLRTDFGSGDVAPERAGEDFFAYRPPHLGRGPSGVNLARLTNVVQRALASGSYAGAVWLEGSPSVEETIYWLNLLIDTTVPIVGNAAQRPHGTLSADGDHNLLDSVDYILSRIWVGDDGRDVVGAVALQDEQIFTAREIQKGDARPGGYVATGGHGGIIGSIGQPGPPVLTFRPVRLHTWRSAVNLTRLPRSVSGVRRVADRIESIPVEIKNAEGELLPTAIPLVTIEKTARFLAQRPTVAAEDEVDILARIEQNLQTAPLAGFVAEGTSPFARMTESVTAALNRAVACGMPVVRVGRGNAEGFAPPAERDLTISGSNLTATKARLLLMACLMRFGAFPPAKDPAHPTDAELKAARVKHAEYQAIFDSH